MTSIQLLEKNGVYVENSLNGRYWCYKYQPKGHPIIICSDADRFKAADKMVKELSALPAPPKQQL